MKYIYIYCHTHVYTNTYMHVKIINEKRGNHLKEGRKEHISGFGLRKGKKEVHLYFNLKNKRNKNCGQGTPKIHSG